MATFVDEHAAYFLGEGAKALNAYEGNSWIWLTASHVLCNVLLWYIQSSCKLPMPAEIWMVFILMHIR